MKRFKEMILYLIHGMSKAVFRFPLTVICLAGATSLIWYMISIHATAPLIIEKMMFTLVVGAFLGMAAQFANERSIKVAKSRLLVYVVSAVLTIGYFLILLPAPEISSETAVRTGIAVFAMLCAVIWLPSYKDKIDFNQTALIHFKSAFTSVLYSGVLMAGLAAIIASIDILLFNVNDDTYGYMSSLVWVMFAPIYYLALLPKFNSDDEADLKFLQRAQNYPRFLEILISYIAIPLITAYTLVLLAYFVKILVTTNWPSGQLGPMILIYSAAGLIIYILASLLENRFAYLYRMIFPKVLIPVVIMQLVSVGIRLNAYGFTESRYYVALFGIFSIVIGIILSIKPLGKNSLIALLAAAFAILSIIPPIDAFTVSRSSQISRVERYLQNEGMLSEGKIIPKENASEETKIETTNILNYLNNRHSLKYIKWLPADFTIYQDMKTTFGFEPTYPNYYPGSPSQYFFANLDSGKPINISGYDMTMIVHSERYMKEQGGQTYPFTIDGMNYELRLERISNEDVRISIKDALGTELISTGLVDFAKGLTDKANEPKEALPPEKLTLDVAQNGYKLKIIFQNINMTMGAGTDSGIDYSAFVFFGN